MAKNGWTQRRAPFALGVVPRPGHVQIYGYYDPDTPSCGIRMMADFFADPTPTPDASCIAELPPSHFLGT